MKINKAEVRFSDKLNIGKLSYYLETDIMGFEEKDEVLAKEASEFAHVIITGDEPFKQKESIRDFVKFAMKLNPSLMITIHTEGNIKPLGLNKFSNFNNIKYVIYGKLAASNIPLDVRTNESSWKYLALAGASFVFTLLDKKQLDEIEMLIAMFKIAKHQVYLNVKAENFKEVCFLAKAKGFNIYFEASQEVFEEDKQ